MMTNVTKFEDQGAGREGEEKGRNVDLDVVTKGDRPIQLLLGGNTNRTRRVRGRVN